MAQQDLRTWIAKLEAAGQLQKVSGAEREEEIGCIVDMHANDMAQIVSTARQT